MVDDSVAEWMALQHDHSASLRLLVRESIQRDGYVDVVNRPVAQLPRRGRPSTGAEDELEQGEAVRPTPAPQVQAVTPIEVEATVDEPDPVPVPVPVAAEVEDDVDPEPIPPAPVAEAEVAETPPAPVSADVNDMLTMLR